MYFHQPHRPLHQRTVETVQQMFTGFIFLNNIEDHTEARKAEGLREVLESWGLTEESQACKSNDSATNAGKAVALDN